MHAQVPVGTVVGSVKFASGGPLCAVEVDALISGAQIALHGRLAKEKQKVMCISPHGQFCLISHPSSPKQAKRMDQFGVFEAFSLPTF